MNRYNIHVADEMDTTVLNHSKNKGHLELWNYFLGTQEGV